MVPDELPPPSEPGVLPTGRFDRDPLPPLPEPPREEPSKLSALRRPFIALVLVIAVSTFVYRLLVVGDLERSAAMFIGLPTLLAVLLALAPAAKTITGSIMKGITLFLLILATLRIEGAICILLASPFFYGIGLIVGLFADRARKRSDSERFRVIMILPLAFMSLEGVIPLTSFNRFEAITVSQATSLSPEQAAAKLAQVPDFNLKALPAFLKMGFPRPVEIHGAGLAKDDTWAIHFAGGEGKPGDLTARVTVSEPGHYVVRATGDTSHIAHWMRWEEAEWTIEPTATGSVVHLTMRYERRLDPSWYFGPSERYGVKKAGEYFLQQTFPGRP